MGNKRTLKYANVKRFEAWRKEHPIIFDDEHNLLIKVSVEIATYTDYKKLNRIFLTNRILDVSIHSMIYVKGPEYPCDIIYPKKKAND